MNDDKIDNDSSISFLLSDPEPPAVDNVNERIPANPPFVNY
jgi:hypothetical protein